MKDKMSANLKNVTLCYHCGNECSDGHIHQEDKVFCCEGCKTVYQILNKNGLCDYYAFNENPGQTQKISIRKDKYAFLDKEDVQVQFIQFSDGKMAQVTFYLPQMHCSSCLWLLENIHRINQGILSSTVNFTKKEAFIVFNQQETTLREVVEALASIGYEPHISLQNLGERNIKAIDRTRWYKIGVAGFAFSNIMIMSLPEYFSGSGGLEHNVAMAFQVFIVLLSIPVIFYSAQEFFVTAWKGLRNRYLNIDAPVALALIITYGRSLYEVFSGTGSGYFDSMSGIVFFMLVGRWLQDRTYQAISFDRDFKSFFPIAVNVVKDSQVQPVRVDELRPDDIIQVHAHEIIPVDAILSKGKAEIDYSFVSGESLPVSAQPGELLYAGGKQLGGMLELIVVKGVSQSYLTNLWNKDVFKRKKPVTTPVIDTISTYFTYVVFVIGAIAGTYWYLQGETQLMWNAITTILIVACPCALLLSANFTNGNILRILSLNKFYLRSPEMIEELSKIKHIVFDKTGTLTQNRKLRIVYSGQLLDADTKTVLASVLQQSNHPASKAIFDYLNVSQCIPVEHFKVSEGKGIEGWVNEQHIKVGSPEFTGIPRLKADGSQVVVVIDGRYTGHFTVSNTYRFGVFNLIHSLKSQFGLSVISGDNDAELATLTSALGDESKVLFNQSPEEKLHFIQDLQAHQDGGVMMIGDGLNDAGALRQSDAGIAVTDSNNTFTPSSDGIIDASRLSQLNKFLAFASDGRRIIMFSFVISIIYNVIGLYFAVQGILSPMIAAILMPSSSISIILITYGMSEWMARKRGLSPEDDKYFNTQKSATWASSSY
jgi:P-type Cu+ transporter